MDSADQTKLHIKTVGEIIDSICNELTNRKEQHDGSKLRSPEKELFDEYTPKLASTTYGSLEYNEMLTALKPALDHHYANNRHHPEHYEGGIDDMSLIDIIEMLADWKAATLRHHNGNISRSLRINATRFHLGPQLYQILSNTIKELWPE